MYCSRALPADLMSTNSLLFFQILQRMGTQNVSIDHVLFFFHARQKPEAVCEAFLLHSPTLVISCWTHKVCLLETSRRMRHEDVAFRQAIPVEEIARPNVLQAEVQIQQGLLPQIQPVRQISQGEQNTPDKCTPTELGCHSFQSDQIFPLNTPTKLPRSPVVKRAGFFSSLHERTQSNNCKCCCYECSITHRFCQRSGVVHESPAFGQIQQKPPVSNFRFVLIAGTLSHARAR